MRDWRRMILALFLVVGTLLFAKAIKRETKPEAQWWPTKSPELPTNFQDDATYLKIYRLQGHIYIGPDGPGGLIHAEHCPCHEQKKIP